MCCTVSVHVGRVRTYNLSGGGGGGELSFGVITSAVESVFFIGGGGGTKSVGRTNLRGNMVMFPNKFCSYIFFSSVSPFLGYLDFIRFLVIGHVQSVRFANSNITTNQTLLHSMLFLLLDVCIE